MNLTWTDVELSVNSIMDQMLRDEWKPDYVMGIVPHGIVPAVIIANRLDIPVYSQDEDETNLWMPVDATGCEGNETKKILIVVGHNGSHDNQAEVLHGMVNEFDSCVPVSFKDTCGKNVRFAAICDNHSSNFSLIQYSHLVSYSLNEEVNFPWHKYNHN